MRKKFLFSLVILIITAVLPIYSFAEPSVSSSASPSASVSPSASSSPSSEPTGFTVLKLESSGPDVTILQMRLRDLGYFCYRATGSYGALTRTAVIGFQEQNKLGIDGTVGENTFNKLFNKNLKRSLLDKATKVISGPVENKKTKTYGTAADWTTVSAIFPKGTTLAVMDFNTQITFNMTRTGGDGHAEVETVTNDDYKNFLKAFGNSPTWEKRAVTVTINGTVYAASLFGWPHGEDTITNNGMEGHTCLYFMGSTSHVFGMEDKEHIEMIKKATAK